MIEDLYWIQLLANEKLLTEEEQAVLIEIYMNGDL